MPLDDLDLEFEDEDEIKKRKNEAVAVDVDLEFQAPTGVAPKRPVQVVSTAASAKPATSPMATVKKLDDARANAAPRPSQPAQRPSTHATPVQGANALRASPDLDEVSSEEVVRLREQMRQTQFDADVKVAVAEFKTEILSELLSDTKLMEHQVNQLLLRINAKHPDMKQEVLMIKKILADFSGKKRK